MFISASLLLIIVPHKRSQGREGMQGRNLEAETELEKIETTALLGLPCIVNPTFLKKNFIGYFIDLHFYFSFYWPF